MTRPGVPVAPEVELRNAGPGPDPFVLRALGHDAAVLLFQRDYHCTNCRAQVADVAARNDEFRARNAAVVSVLPEPVERAREWADAPFPVLADPDGAVGESYGQRVRFGPLGRVHDLIGRMPVAAVVDCRPDEPRLVHVHRGDDPWDRPSVDDLLARVDDLLADDGTDTVDDDPAGPEPDDGPDGDAGLPPSARETVVRDADIDE
jgi:peroxiredoxin Q/BCP